MLAKRFLPSLALVSLALLAAPSHVSALIVRTYQDPSPSAVTIADPAYDEGGTYEWFIDIDKRYENTDSIWIEFIQESNEDYGGFLNISEDINNSTGLQWKDFHMKLWTLDVTGALVPSSNVDGLFFDDDDPNLDTGPFASSWLNANDIDEMWLWEGSWLHSATDTLAFRVGGSGWSTGVVDHFVLEQWPTTTGGPDEEDPGIPEPGTLLLLASSVGGWLLRKRLA